MDTEKLLQGYGILTAEILYRRPDAPSLLQTYVWQDYDMAPKFDRLMSFLGFWRRELEGPLHSVRYSHQHLIKPGTWKKIDGEVVLH
ncbi:MAG: aspartate-semialdehyde dehydrogenase [Pseudomonadota bacterium]